jgi:hypothetical protein
MHAPMWTSAVAARRAIGKERSVTRNEDPPVLLGAAAAAAGRGLVAGLAGTAAMTIARALLNDGRQHDDHRTEPARAAGRVLGVAPVDEGGERRFNRIVHWAYGSAWGAFRGILAAVGVRGPAADVAHLGAVWGAEQLVLPATRTAPAPTHGRRPDVAADVTVHAVYAAATGVALRWMERR